MTLRSALPLFACLVACLVACGARPQAAASSERSPEPAVQGTELAPLERAPAPAAETSRAAASAPAVDEPWGGLRTWRFRVVDSDTRQPIAGARVRAWEDGETQSAGELLASTGADGTFEVRDCIMLPPLAVVADGYGLALCRALFEQSVDRAHVAEIGLHAGAELRVRVVSERAELVDAELAARGSEIGDSFSPIHSLGWTTFSAAPSPKDLLLWRDLPARVDLTLRATLSTGQRIAWPSSSSLEPGETRELEWRLDPPVHLSGLLCDAEGGAVAGHALWLVPVGAWEPRGAEWRLMAPAWRPTIHGWTVPGEELERIVTEGDGRFERFGVAPGDYWIGPEPMQLHSKHRDPRRLVPLAQRLTIAPEARAVHVTVRTVARRTVRGAVRLPDGSPAGGWIGVRADGYAGQYSEQLENGAFEIECLPDVELVFQARQGWHFLPSLPRVVRRGESSVDLELRPGCTLAGRVEGPGARLQGQPRVTFTRLDVESAPITLPVDSGSGAFRHPCLEPGRYAVTASDAGGAWGAVRDLQLAPGAALEGVRVFLRAGVRVRLSNLNGEEPLLYFVRSDAGLVAAGVLDPGDHQFRNTPAGSLDVEVRSGTARFVRRLEASDAGENSLDLSGP